MVNESIIDVIQKMVQEGQSQETIISTLKDLGVNDEQAKKLLLIAEADTFTLLKKEINSLVKEEFVAQKKDFEELIHKDLGEIEQEQKANVKTIALQQLDEVKTDVIEQSKGFEDRVNKLIGGSQKTVSMVKIALDSINERISQMELDVEQLKVHKFRKKSMFFSYVMLGLGAVLLILSILLLLINFSKIDNAQILMIAIMVLASITLMFASIVG